MNAGARVLVVEDDPVVRSLETAILQSGGYSVIGCGDAVEALTALGDGPRCPFDLIILDHHLPGTSGLELLAQLRRNSATQLVPIILVTAMGEVSSRVEGLAAGADDYVTKPFAPDELLARVEARVRQHDAWRQLVTAHLEERASIGRMLRGVGAASTLEARAATLCQAFSDIRDVQGAALLLLSDDDTAELVAAAPPGLIQLGSGEVAAAAGKALAARAAFGPWVGPAPFPLADPYGLRRFDGDVAFAPLGHNGDVRGILTLIPSSGGSVIRDRVLAACIDFAPVVQAVLQGDLEKGGQLHHERGQIGSVLQGTSFRSVYQPIVDLRDPARPVVGFEALTRFDDGIAPDRRFRAAAALGLGHEVEMITLKHALAAAASLPSDGWLSVNVSPSFLERPEDLADQLRSIDRGIVLEISEQEPVSDYAQIQARVRELGPSIRLSVDDAGSGFSSLRHILELQPDFVKLDRSWITSVESDPARQALIAGLVYFGATTGSELIAEGIETEAELGCLRDLGVGFGQGFHLGVPVAAQSPADRA